MNEELQKYIKIKLKIKANKTKMTDNIAVYKKQWNYVGCLNKDFKQNYFDSLDTKKGAKPFWNVCKPYFSNKNSRGDTNIMLIEKDELILSEMKIATTFSNFFSQIGTSLKLFILSKVLSNVTCPLMNYDRIDCTVVKYKHHS